MKGASSMRKDLLSARRTMTYSRRLPSSQLVPWKWTLSATIASTFWHVSPGNAARISSLTVGSERLRWTVCIGLSFRLGLR